MSRQSLIVCLTISLCDQNWSCFVSRSFFVLLYTTSIQYSPDWRYIKYYFLENCCKSEVLSCQTKKKLNHFEKRYTHKCQSCQIDRSHTIDVYAHFYYSNVNPKCSRRTKSQIELKITQLYMPQVPNHHQLRWMPCFGSIFFHSSANQRWHCIVFFLFLLKISNLIISIWLIAHDETASIYFPFSYIGNSI